MAGTTLPPKIAIIIPAYNEADAISDVILSISQEATKLELNFDIIVVNDCSTDFTAEIVEAFDCILLNLPSNLGIGGAVQTGYKYAYLNKYDFAMQIDGDGQHPPAEIHIIIFPALAQEADVIIGSRFINYTGFQSTILRRFGINYFKFLINLFCGIVITDCTSGFRIINRKALEIANNYYPDEYPEPESVIQYHLSGMQIKEFQVEMSQRMGGKSSIKAFNTLYYMIKVSIAILFTYIRVKRKNK